LALQADSFKRERVEVGEIRCRRHPSLSHTTSCPAVGRRR
jgi:hypothetical protein